MRKLFMCTETFYPHADKKLEETEIYELIEYGERWSFLESIRKYDDVYCVDNEELDEFLIPILPSGKVSGDVKYKCIDNFIKDSHHFKQNQVYTLFKDDNTDLWLMDEDNNLYIIPKMDCFDRFTIQLASK